MTNDAFNTGIAGKVVETAAAQGHLDSFDKKGLNLTEELEERKAAQTKAQETVDDLKAGLETFISELEEEKSENIGFKKNRSQLSMLSQQLNRSLKQERMIRALQRKQQEEEESKNVAVAEENGAN